MHGFTNRFTTLIGKLTLSQWWRQLNGHTSTSGEKSDISIVLGRDGQKVRNASPCRISSKSVKPRPRTKIWRFSIFQHGGRRHLVFLKFQIFNGRAVNRVEVHHHVKFRENRSKRSRDMVIFRFFKMAAAAILDFGNFKILTIRMVKRVELHHRATFRQNRSNRGWDITIFQFFHDGGRWICNACVGTTHEEHLVVFITVKNLVGIGAVVLIMYTFFDFASLAWKRIFPPKLGFLGVCDPLNGVQCEKLPKRHILARVRVVWAIMRKNPLTCLTCRWLPQKGYK